LLHKTSITNRETGVTDKETSDTDKKQATLIEERATLIEASLIKKQTIIKNKFNKCHLKMLLNKHHRKKMLLK